MSLSEREKYRHSVIRGLAEQSAKPVQQPAGSLAEDQPSAPKAQTKAEQPRAKKRKAQASKNASDDQKLQRAYYYDVDVVKAIHMKSISEGISLSEAANAALRKGLAAYLKALQSNQDGDEESC